MRRDDQRVLRPEKGECVQVEVEDAEITVYRFSEAVRSGPGGQSCRLFSMHTDTA